VQQDKSAYWTPILYYEHANGSYQEVHASATTVYYLDRGDNHSHIEPFPPGFRMISGDSQARLYNNAIKTYLEIRPVADRVTFACLDISGPMPEQHYLARSNCSHGLRAQISFQSCWDGVSLFKDDQSHVAYMSQIDNGKCPPTHPRQLAHLFLEVLYDVNTIDTSRGGRYVFSNGDATGYGFHGDFLNGWDMAIQTAAMKQCFKDGSAGTIESCPPLQASADPYFAWNCPERPALVDERVQGLLDKLPGCNLVTGFQAARAPSTNCPARLSSNAVPVDLNNRIPLNPTPGLTAGNWSYLGCAIEDGRIRALTGPAYADPVQMTTDSCRQYCANKEYPIAGLEYGRECWCGNTISSTSPLLPPGSCASMAPMVCAGNHYEYCGAPNMIMMWNNTAHSQSTQPR
jgi:hypothetical protein